MYDVVVGGHGYMVRAGTYERRQGGFEEAATVRARLFDFYGGGRRAAQLERDRFWSGAGSWPALDSQGLAAGPKRTDRTESPTPAFDPASPSFTFVYGGTTYVANGTGLFRVNTSGGNYAGLVLVQSLAAVVTGCAQVVGFAVFAHGLGQKLTIYDLNAGTYNTTANSPKTVQLAGSGGIVYGFDPGVNRRQVWYWDPSIPSAGAATITLDTEVVGLAEIGAGVWTMTRNSLYEMQGGISYTTSNKLKAVAPRTGFTDDLAWWLGHNGEVYAWLGKEVQRYDSATDSFARLGLAGGETLGACAVGDWLVVGVVDVVSGNCQFWGWDGRGWWLLEDDASPTAYRYPVSIVGAAADADMLAGRSTTTNRTATWQFWPRSGLPGLRSSYSVVTSMLDGGERDIDKAWRQVGVELAWPDARGSSATVTVAVAYSADGGATWTTAATATVAGNAARTHTIAGPIAAGTSSRWLQVKVSVSGVSTWAPVIAGVWAEYQRIDEESRRRRWRFAVQCKDKVVKRDGSVDTTGARALAGQLWAVWSAGGVVTFRDVDYDLTTTEHTARIVGIREEIAKPQDAAAFADGLVELTLVEV